MPFQLVTSPFFSFDNQGRRKVDDAAGKGRWEQAAVPGLQFFPCLLGKLLSPSAIQQTHLLPAVPWGSFPSYTSLHDNYKARD